MSRNKKIEQKQKELRSKLWPDVNDDNLWQRQRGPGFTTIPRLMPLIMVIMDDMSKNKPVSSTYLELFCRAFDDYMINLSKPREMAFHAGFTGQRAERTWKERLVILEELGFIKLQKGSSGPYSYALILNPFYVIKEKYGKHPGIVADKYNALIARASEVGAKDLDETETKNEGK